VLIYLFLLKNCTKKSVPHPCALSPKDSGLYVTMILLCSITYIHASTKCTFLYSKSGISDLKALFVFCFAIVFFCADKEATIQELRITPYRGEQTQIKATMNNEL